VADVYAALWVSIALALINILIKPIVSIFTLPLNIVTLGLFGLVVNGALLYFVPAVVSGFAIGTFFAAFLGALAISVVNWVISKI
jgi:putative membrane protein